ncbi:MAG: DUF4403 family protein [Bergeyella sp.]
MKILKFLLLFCFITVFSQQTLEEYTFPKIKSSLTMPVRIPLSEISNIVNASVGNLVYQDDSYTDNDNDQFKVKVWKTKQIKLSGGKNQNIIIEVPLKIWAEKGIGTFGVYTYQETTFETVMYFSTSVVFKNNWTVSTTTVPAGYKWVSKPVLDYGKIKIPITTLVEKSLKEQQTGFCKIIDKQMESQLNFQQYAVIAWNLFAQPFNVSEEYNTWLKITPLSVNVTPLVFYADAIDMNIGIDTYSETFTGRKPASSPEVRTVANFNSVQSLPPSFLLQTTANVPFTEATSIAKNMFLNKEFDFRDGKSKIKITDIKVYRDEERIMIEAQTEGAVEGTSYISGIPVYDEFKRKIVLNDTKFNLKTKNILQKTATLLFKGKIIKMIEEEYGIPTQEIEDSSKKSVEETFNKEYYKGLKMSGRVQSLKPSKVLMSDNGITAVIDMQANLRLLVKGF